MNDQATGGKHAGMDVSDLRRSVTDRALSRENLDADPFLEFEAIVEDDTGLVDTPCDEASARSKIERLCAAFGIASQQIVGSSYADLFGQAGQ